MAQMSMKDLASNLYDDLKAAKERIAELEVQIRDVQHELIETSNHRAELVKQIAALTWTPISESNLPDWKSADEIGGWKNGRWSVGTAGTGGTASSWICNGWTHTRKSNPPAPERGAK